MSEKSKEAVVYKPGEYFDENKAKDLPSSPISFMDLLSAITLTTGSAVAIPIIATAGDFATGGIVGGVSLALATVTSMTGKRDRLRWKLAQISNNRNSYIEMPEGINKSMLPLVDRIFPVEFRIESVQPRAEESLNRSLSKNDPRNMITRFYIVKTVRGKTKYHELPSNDPMESWDKLFAQETGGYIDAHRPGQAHIYRKMERATKTEITAAKLKVTLDKTLNRETPIWIEEVARKSI